MKAAVLFVAGVAFVDFTPPSWATMLAVTVWLAVAIRVGQLDARRRRRADRRKLACWTIRNDYVKQAFDEVSP